MSIYGRGCGREKRSQLKTSFSPPPPLPALHSLSPSGRVLAKFLVLSYNEKKTARRNDKILYLTKEE